MISAGREAGRFLERSRRIAAVGILVGVLAVASVGCGEPAEPIGTLKLDVTSSTWREGKEPYDIQRGITKRLRDAGFRVVSDWDATCDARLSVDYREQYDATYITVPAGGGAAGSTKIVCEIQLRDRLYELVYEKTIPGSAKSSETCGGYVSLGQCLYDSALKDFTTNHSYVNLGETIASKLGLGG
jgi:hypothetical protein